MRSMSGPSIGENDSMPGEVAKILRVAAYQFGKDSILSRTSDILEQESQVPKTLESVVAALSNKRPENLTEEDYGKAAGILQITAEIKKTNEHRRERQEFELVDPNGKRLRFAKIENSDAAEWFKLRINDLIVQFSLSSDEASSVALAIICNTELLPPSAGDALGPSQSSGPSTKAFDAQ